jgi:cell division protein FtsZ
MSQDQLISPPKALRARIVGVGSAGCHFAEHILATPLAELPLAVVHTNARVLQQHPVAHRVLIGVNRTHGLGSGGDADMARVMAEESGPDLAVLVQDTDLLFIFAGLGGGTGTGVAPVLARAGKKAGALVIAFVTTPFQFEGPRPQKQAQHGLQHLRAVADAVISLPNEKILKLLDENTTVLHAFARVNELLVHGLQGIWQMLTRPGVINVDFGYLHSALRGRHTESVLAAAEAGGESRAREAIDLLLANPLLDSGKALAEADHVLLSIIGPNNLTIAEINCISEQLRRYTETEDVVIGTALDDSLGENISLTLIASKSGKSAILATDGETQVMSAAANEFDTALTEAPRRPAPRFVAPPPETTPEKTRELADKQSNGRILKAATKWKQELLALEIVSRGRFEKSEPTIHRGADLDVPTYVRRGVPLN